MDFDNENDVKEYIKDLKTLHEVEKYRYNQGYNLHKRLSDFKIFNGQLWFDTCGNTLVRETVDCFCDSYSHLQLPKEEDICSYCGKHFNVYHLEDILITGSDILYHKVCSRYNMIDIATKEFKDIFSKVYDLHDLEFRAIPNQYDNWEGYEPWFIVTTPNGDIKIGWKKRVINIEWLDNYKHFTEKFEDENVTRQFDDGKRLIHAWGRDKCTEYLTRAKNSVRS